MEHVRYSVWTGERDLSYNIIELNLMLHAIFSIVYIAPEPHTVEHMVHIH